MASLGVLARPYRLNSETMNSRPYDVMFGKLVSYLAAQNLEMHQDRNGSITVCRRQPKKPKTEAIRILRERISREEAARDAATKALGR